MDPYTCDKCGRLGGKFDSNFTARAELAPKGWHVGSNVYCPEHVSCMPSLDDALPLGETQIKPTAAQVAAWAKAADERLKEAEDEDEDFDDYN